MDLMEELAASRLPCCRQALAKIEHLEFEYDRADDAAKRLGRKWKEAIAVLQDYAKSEIYGERARELLRSHGQLNQ